MVRTNLDQPRQLQFSLKKKVHQNFYKFLVSSAFARGDQASSRKLVIKLAVPKQLHLLVHEKRDIQVTLDHLHKKSNFLKITEKK